MYGGRSWCVRLVGLGGGADPSSPEGGGYLQGTPMLKLARVLSRFLVESEYELYLGAPVYL